MALVSLFFEIIYYLFYLLLLLILGYAGLSFTLWSYNRGTFWRRREFLKGVDAAFIKQDIYNCSFVNAMCMLKGSMTGEELTKTIVEGMLCHERMRQRVVYREWLPLYWENVEINLQDHIFIHEEPMTEKQLMDVMSEEQVEQMCFEKPLWKMRYFTSVEGGRSALYFRYQHAYADGISAMRMLMGITPQPHHSNNKKPTPKKKRKVTPLTLVPKLSSCVKDLFFTQYDPKSLLKPHTWQQLDTKRLVRWAIAPVSVTELKSLCKTFQEGVTLNDVLLSSLSSCLRRYCEEEGQPLGHDLMACVMVSLQGLDIDSKVKFGNYVSAVPVTLPTTETDVFERLEGVNKTLKNLKESITPFVVKQILNLIGCCPAPMSRFLFTMSQKVSLTMTNVPGPQATTMFGPLEMEGITFVVPPMGDVHFLVCILTFNGRIYITISADTAAVRDPMRMCELFGEELDIFKEKVEKRQ